MLLDDAIRLFLDSIGRSEEYEFYLKKFRSDRSACFALLVPDLESVEEAAEALVYSADFLLRLELAPALLLSGPRAQAMHARLLEYGLEHQTLRLSGDAFAQTTNAVDGGQPDAPGERELAALMARAVRRREAAVILWPEQTVGAAIHKLIDRVSPRVHLIRIRGALRSPEERPLLYFRRNVERPEDLAPEDRSVAELGAWLLDRRRPEDGPRLHLSVTSPFNLMKEIFTVKGAGTIVRDGSRIRVIRDMQAVDMPRLLRLLSQSFRKELTNPDFLDRASCVYLEENYQGAIVMEERPEGSYLSKFAVDTQARGLGVAQELWDLAIERHPALFWRSRSSNSINRWYARLAEGLQRAEPWNIFWRGTAPEHIPGIIDFCRSRAEDFAPARPGD